MFLLKKIVSQFFMPVTVITGLLLIGLILLRFTGCRRAARAVLAGATLAFLIMGYGVFSDPILAGLECHYPPLDIQTARDADIRWVVVLAGGHVSSESLPVTSQLLDETLVRLVEGIRIQQSLPGARLLVSGGRISDPKASAVLMAELARGLGVDPADIVVEDASRDTHEEALLIRPMMGPQQFVLVTSAYHMPRSMALFRAQGMQPVAAPVGHRIIDRDYLSAWSFFPHAKRLRNCEIVVHELLGIFQAYLTGKLRQRHMGERVTGSGCPWRMACITFRDPPEFLPCAAGRVLVSPDLREVCPSRYTERPHAAGCVRGQGA